MGLTKDLGSIPRAITVDTSNRVGMGTTTPSEILDIRGSSLPTIKIRNNTASSGNYSQLLFEVANTFSGASSSYIRSISTNTGNSATDLSFGVNANGGGSPFEAMRITSGGLVLIGTNDAGYGARLNSISASTSGLFLTSDGTSNVINVWANAGGGNNPFIGFLTDGGSQRGNIDYNRGSNVVRYNTSSDANLKNIIGDSDKQKSIEILNSTRIREYSWKDDETNKPQIGVIAQELYQTFKGAVSQGSNDEDFGSENYKNWAVDKTAFTFHLIAGWQEHERLIQELTARLEILENK